jgi:5-methylcytosine-specific restriction endonuclease McrA
MDNPTTKLCAKCGETKPLTQYYPHKTGRDGYAARCKSCVGRANKAYCAANTDKVRARKQRYRIAHVAERRAYDAAYVATHREERIAYLREYHRANRVKLLADAAAYREAHRDELRVKQRQRYHAAPEGYRETTRRWYAAHRERARQYGKDWRGKNRRLQGEYQRRRRARKHAAQVVPFSHEAWEAILDYFGHACAYCGVTGIALTQDHVVPLARGGTHTAANVVPACNQCNGRKTDNPLWRFLMTD